MRYDLVDTLIQITDFLMINPLVNREHSKHLSKKRVDSLGNLQVGRLHAEGEPPCHVANVLQDNFALDNVQEELY